MTDKKIDLSELKDILSSCAPKDNDSKSLNFGEGKLVDTCLFSFLMPDEFVAEEKVDGFEVICYKDDFSFTPMQITIKSEPLILISQQEHYEKLQASILNTKGMVVKTAQIADKECPRFDLPTLGGQQMFFPLYHTTEVFSLRINFVGQIANAEEIAKTVLKSFSFKDFKPRVPKEMVDSIYKVFSMNRSNFAKRFKTDEANLESSQEAADLCQNYARALYGCLRVLNHEINNLKGYDISKESMAELVNLGKDFYHDMSVKLEYGDETFTAPAFEDVEMIIADWENCDES